MKGQNDDYADYHSQTLVWDDNGDKKFDNGSRMYSNIVSNCHFDWSAAEWRNLFNRKDLSTPLCFARDDNIT